MQTEYDPVKVVEDLISKQAFVNIICLKCCVIVHCYSNTNACDEKGRSALHLLAAANGSVHARKMFSLLLQNGSSVGKKVN